MASTHQLEHHLRQLEHDQTTLAHHAINLARDAISSLKRDKIVFLNEKKSIQKEISTTMDEIERIKHEAYKTKIEQKDFSYIHNIRSKSDELKNGIIEFKKEEQQLAELEKEVREIENVQLKKIEDEIRKIEYEVGVLHTAEQTLEKDVHSIISPEDLNKIMSEVNNVTANVRQRVQELHSIQSLGTKKLQIEQRIQSIVNRGKKILQKEDELIKKAKNKTK